MSSLDASDLLGDGEFLLRKFFKYFIPFPSSYKKRCLNGRNHWIILTETRKDMGALVVGKQSRVALKGVLF